MRFAYPLPAKIINNSGYKLIWIIKHTWFLWQSSYDKYCLTFAVQFQLVVNMLLRIFDSIFVSKVVMKFPFFTSYISILNTKLNVISWERLDVVYFFPLWHKLTKTVNKLFLDIFTGPTLKIVSTCYFLEGWLYKFNTKFILELFVVAFLWARA